MVDVGHKAVLGGSSTTINGAIGFFWVSSLYCDLDPYAMLFPVFCESLGPEVCVWESSFQSSLLTEFTPPSVSKAMELPIKMDTPCGPEFRYELFLSWL